MVKGNIIKLLSGILIVLCLLTVCIGVDAANDTVSNIDETSNIMDGSKITIMNDTTVICLNESASHFVAKSSDKIYTTKQKTITITSKPSCGCRYSYAWHTFTFVSYCPHCHKYGTLRNVHKWPARHEQELTCDPKLGGCGADYCGCCGKEKYSWSRYYLKKA